MYFLADYEFYGFAKDMLDKISENLNLECSLFEVADGTTGRKLPNGSWTGMIGTLIRNVRVFVFITSSIM